MVPVTHDSKNTSEEPQRSWWDLLQALRRRLHTHASGSTLDCALANYILRSNETGVIKLFDPPPFDADQFVKQYVQSATNAATLGYLLGAGLITPQNTNVATERFKEGFNQCAAQAKPTAGPSVHTDPKLLLGLVAGSAKIHGEGNLREWLASHLTTLAEGNETAKAILGAIGLAILNNTWTKLEEVILKATPTTASELLTMLYALQYEPTRFSDTRRNELNRVRQNALREVHLVTPDSLDALSCAIGIRVATNLLGNSVQELDQTAISRLTNIIHRLPNALKRETAPLADEYGVQRVLWTMLAGVYPDLRDETWLAQFGVYQPRTDLAIESLKTVIEAKYIRKAADFRKVQDEIVSDATTYTQRPARINKIIAVIYDNTSSQHQYEQMCTDLKKVPGIADVIITAQVMPRPTKRKPARKTKR